MLTLCASPPPPHRIIISNRGVHTLVSDHLNPLCRGQNIGLPHTLGIGNHCLRKEPLSRAFYANLCETNAQKTTPFPEKTERRVGPLSVRVGGGGGGLPAGLSDFDP